MCALRARVSGCVFACAIVFFFAIPPPYRSANSFFLSPPPPPPPPPRLTPHQQQQITNGYNKNYNSSGGCFYGSISYWEKRMTLTESGTARQPNDIADYLKCTVPELTVGTASATLKPGWK